ncbi:MAG: HAD-IA family hydrolase [Geobacter sp.]|nr:HAD-IA family hydrolase [Geobacter sp.]
MTQKRQHILARPCWVFDLDGTLTVPVHDFAAIRAELGIPAGDDILAHLAEQEQERADWMQQQLARIENSLADKTEAASGATPLIRLLAERGARLGILTRNTRETALSTLDKIGLAGHFHQAAIIGREESLPKPDPEGIQRLAALWGALPEQMVMVGDYLYDLQCGRAAGTATIHVDPAGRFRWPELADLCVRSLVELAERLAAR